MELYLTSHVPFYCLLRGSFDFTRIFNLQQLSYVRVEYCITLVLLWKRFTACCFMLHSVCLFACLSVCLSAYLSVCLSVCLSVFLSVCLPLSVHRPISTPALSQPLQSLYHLQSGTKTHSVPELQHLNKHRTVELHRVLIVSCLCGCAVLHSKAQPECSRLLTANGEYRGQTVCGVDWCCGVRETWV